MLNKKSLFYGIGCGLIAGAALLQLMNSAVSPHISAVPSSSVTPEEMSRQQLKEAASKQFQVFDKDQKLFTQAQLDASVQQKLKEEKDKQPPASAQTPQQTVKETYVLISKGLTAGNVADLLLSAGVITDRKSFEDAMASKQLNDKIVAGIHVFKGTQDLNQILTNITSQ